MVVTGGEPLLARQIEELTDKLKQSGAHVTIETAATIYKPIAADLISLSPKLANSTPWKKAGGKFATMHEQRRLNLPVIQRFIENYDYQLKFVVERREDFVEIGALLDQLRRGSGASFDHAPGDHGIGIEPKGALDRRTLQETWLPVCAALAHSAFRQSARHLAAASQNRLRYRREFQNY